MQLIGFVLHFTYLMVTVNANAELALVHVVWRHGDRTPIKVCRNDPNQENTWPQGFGALTVLGMEQQVTLGKLLQNEYIEKLKFLSSGYKSNEIYIRSTDVNRTLRSAEANLIGMYYKSPGLRPGIDYPIMKEWPQGFVAIPVHTVERSTDNVANPLFDCPRREWLWEQIKHTSEYVKLNEDSEDLLKTLSKLCGEKIRLDDLWFVQQATMIEKEYNRTTIIDDPLFDRITTLTHLLSDMREGLEVEPHHGIDFHVELAKIRGGGLLWEILNRVDHKIYCQRNSHKHHSCKWIDTLKYYVYSAHDNTITALLSTLGAKQKVVPHGYPGYASAVIVELWKNDNQEYFFKFKFRYFKAEVLEDITSKVDGCEEYAAMCPVSIIYQKSLKFYQGNPEKLCNDVTSKSTKFIIPKNENSDDKYFLEHNTMERRDQDIVSLRLQDSSSDCCYLCIGSLLPLVISFILISVSPSI